MGRRPPLNSVRALWIVALLDGGRRRRLITSRRFPTVEVTAADLAPDDETVMGALESIPDLEQRCDLILDPAAMRLAMASLDAVSVLILPSVTGDEIALGTATLLADTFCAWLAPYVARLDEGQLWPISLPLALVFSRTMPFGEFDDTTPLVQVYNDLVEGTPLPKMGPAAPAPPLGRVVIDERTICWFDDDDSDPRGLQLIGTISYQGCASAAKSPKRFALPPTPNVQRLRTHEKATLENGFDRNVITFSPPSDPMPVVVAKYDWAAPFVPIANHSFRVDSVDERDDAVRTTLEVTFSRFVRDVEVVLELDDDAVVQRSGDEVDVRPIGTKRNEFVWRCGNVLTNGTITREITWSSRKPGDALRPDRSIEVRCTTDSMLALLEGAGDDDGRYLRSNLSRNRYRIKFRNCGNDQAKRR